MCSRLEVVIKLVVRVIKVVRVGLVIVAPADLWSLLLFVYLLWLFDFSGVVSLICVFLFGH